MSDLPRILIIDDEIQIRRLLQITLESNGYKIYAAASGEEGLQQVAMTRPDMLILDLGLPDMDGIEALKKLREWSSIPVIILSVRSNETDIVAALDAGADDYLNKPFRTGELLARIRTALRHVTSPDGENSIFESGPLWVDLNARIVKIKNEIIKLTPTEFRLLSLFIRHAGKVITHQFILNEIWGPSFAEETQYSRVYVGQLRKKIEENPTTPKLLVTESGIGYRLEVIE